MGFPSTYISLHMVNVVSAVAPGGVGNPLTLMIKSFGGDAQITLHLPTPQYADRMADAISAAVRVLSDPAPEEQGSFIESMLP